MTQSASTLTPGLTPSDPPESKFYQTWLRHIGRGLLGLYFFVPGVLKLFDLELYEGTMTTHGVPLVVPALWITIVLQVGGGLLLIIGYRTQLMAFLLAGLALLINVFIHDFWNVYEGLTVAHELQNFIKNLGIIAGLLYIAGTPAMPNETRN